VTQLSFLNEFGVTFGRVFEQINGKDKTILYLLLGFSIILKFKNSSFYTNNFILNRNYLVLNLIFFFVAISMMSTVSEFLYFNF